MHAYATTWEFASQCSSSEDTRSLILTSWPKTETNTRSLILSSWPKTETIANKTVHPWESHQQIVSGSRWSTWPQGHTRGVHLKWPPKQYWISWQHTLCSAPRELKTAKGVISVLSTILQTTLWTGTTWKEALLSHQPSEKALWPETSCAIFAITTSVQHSMQDPATY